MRPIAGLMAGCLLAGCAESADTAKQDETAASPTLDSAVAGAIGDTVEDTLRADTASSLPARAVMRDSAGRELGVLTLTTTPGGVTIEGRLTGVAPGEHGIHVHTVGRCDPPFESAGGHWNPTNRHHGEQNPAGGPHVGDLLNVTVPANGIVEISQTTHGGSLHGDVRLMDADGAAVVLHGGADDYRSDPSGNSGPRIACGVVEGG
jgi:superoxide dismutase, Cu-Zn family